MQTINHNKAQVQDSKAWDGARAAGGSATAGRSRGRNRWILLFAVAAVVLLVAWIFSLGQTGVMVSESQRVELGGAKAADVTVEIGAGAITIAGGAADLLNGEFEYNIPEWKPVVSYAVIDNRGILLLRQADDNAKGGKDAHSAWELRLNDSTPTTLTAKLGAGDADFRLGGMALSRLQVNAGVGNVTIDLTGQWKQDLAAVVHGGVGNITLRLPAGTGAQVSVKSGLGNIESRGMKISGDSYLNDAFGKTDHTLSIDVEAGIGNIVLEVAQ